MGSGRSGSELWSGKEPAADLWRHTLARIPTLFGRLIYLSSLRNDADKSYSHPALTQMVGAEQANDTLRRSHGRVFQDWLCLNLEQQKADLQEYLAEIPRAATVIAEWKRNEPYSHWAPSHAQDVEKDLFKSDLKTLLELLKHEYGAASPDPES